MIRDGKLSPGERIFDLTSASGQDALDRMKVDENGHVCVSSPVGIWILSPEGDERVKTTVYRRGFRIQCKICWYPREVLKVCRHAGTLVFSRTFPETANRLDRDLRNRRSRLLGHWTAD